MKWILEKSVPYYTFSRYTYKNPDEISTKMNQTQRSFFQLYVS